MKQHGHGAEMISAIDGEVKKVLGFAIVDDSDLALNNPDVNAPAERSFGPFQEMINDWSGLLAAVAGAVRPDKTFISVADYHWMGTKWCYRTKDEMPAQFFLKDPAGVTQPLNWLEYNQAEETLGYQIAIGGTHKAQQCHVHRKVDDFSQSS
jgi:hypothetical protein